MPLNKDVYTALEDVVGPENIYQAPEIVYSYALRFSSVTQVERNSAFSQTFEAILLPQSTQEVQSIVRLCNKYKLAFKAGSSSWGSFNDSTRPGCIKLDMRRMNHIIEINEKDMYAVVESYVLSAQLQAELMKRGLNCNIIGAGSNCSANPYAAHAGGGHMNQTTSYRERNILGTEWVTPEGDIVRMGSLGSSGKWFCGDGPGPSLRGIVCGTVAPLGGMGVFTKAATKVYHWPGPATMPLEGVAPVYYPKEMPKYFLYRYFSFPTAEDLIKAEQKIGESEIAYELMGFNAAMLASNMATDNDEDYAYANQFAKLVQGPGFQVIITGNSEGDFEYKKAVLDQILKETHGKSLEPVEDPKLAAGLLWRSIRISGSAREMNRAAGTGFGGYMGGAQTISEEIHFMEGLNDIRKDLIKRGVAVDDAGGGYMNWTMENGHFGHGECTVRFAIGSSPEEIKQAKIEFQERATKLAIDTYGVPTQLSGDKVHNYFGPLACNYHLWLKKIKKTFDPNGVSESSDYISG
jgi:glycolate oxidase